MLSTVATWLFGCSHRRTSFPITLRNRSAPSRRDSTETYVVCLDCGRHFEYDWAHMRVTGAKQDPAAVETTRAERGLRARTPLEEGYRLFYRLVHHT